MTRCAMFGLCVVFAVCSLRLLGHLAGAEVFHPPITNVALERPVTLDPADSICGKNNEEEFCKSTEEKNSVESCRVETCDASFPGTAAGNADYANLLDKAKNISAHPECVTKSTFLATNRSTSYSVQFNGTGSDRCGVEVDYNTFKFILNDIWTITFSTWIYSTLGSSSGTLVQMSDSNGDMLLRVSVKGGVVALQSGDVTYTNSTWKVPDEEWIHLAVQVRDDTASVFLDGGFVYPAVHGITLLNPRITSQIQVGESIDGSDSFNGYLQDVRLYLPSLTNRQVVEILTGMLPQTRIQNTCKCPEEYPALTGNDELYCTKNPPVPHPFSLYRVNDKYHAPEFVNDGKLSTFWVSAIKEDNVAVSVDLQDQYEVRRVQLVFYSPYPSVIRIERRLNATSPWQSWQFYSQSCRDSTGYSTNSKLTAPGDISCKFVVEPNEDTKYTGGVITFDLLEGRPGQGEDGAFDDELRQFMLASAVKVRLEGHPSLPNNNEKRHTYHGITELKVEAMCNCHGHGTACDGATPYTCTCAPSSHTSGPRCTECVSGTFRTHDRSAYAEDLCQECACLTDGTVAASAACDPLGGQCACKPHTTGRQCDRCETGYYNLTSSDPDGCQRCVCDAVGTVNASTTCDPATGQCPCKTNVAGIHCDQCATGYFNLTEVNPDGCDSCSCSEAGTSATDRSCDLHTGQCRCKKHVTGLNCDQCTDGFAHLTSSNPDGCESCDCDVNGSLSDSCDVITGQCRCRANVTGLKCDRCVDGLYALDGAVMRQDGCQTPCSCNVTGTDPAHVTTCERYGGQCRCKVKVGGHDCDTCTPDAFSFGASAADGCLACGCDTRGTVDGSVTCDATSGQCACKPNVQSLKCSACTPGSFGLNASHVDGCEPCDCYSRGVTLNSTCDPVDGQCQCQDDAGDVSKGGRRCMAYVETMSPSYGPRSGGTAITINGGFLGDVTNTTVLLKDRPCRVDATQSSATRVVCLSESVTADRLGESLAATVSLSGDVSLKPEGSFVYKEDPVIKQVQPVDCILGGGVVLTVTGTHIDSVARPVMTITVFLKWSRKQQFLVDCAVRGADEMLCVTPKFSLSTTSNRKRRATDDLTGADSKFYIGFNLDGVTTFRNMSNVAAKYGLLGVHPNPEFKKFDGVKMYRPHWPYNDEVIVVEGNHLNLGATVNDYSMTIGRTNCTSLSLDSNQITCIPPETQPEPGASGDSDGDPGVTVRVGNVVAFIGYVRYEPTFWDNAQLRNAVIGGVIALVLVIVLIVVCAVVCWRRRRLSRDDSHPRLEMTDKGNGKNPYISAYYSGSQSGYLTACSGGLLEILSPELKDKIGDVLILDPKRMVLGKLIAEGGYGRVHIGRLADEFHNHHTPVTIKTLRDRDITPRDISDFLEESVMLKDFKHDHVLGLVGVAIEKNHPYVLLPYMENGDLKSFISNEENMLTVGELIDYGRQVAKGMCYLAERHFVHRDLACRNCMVSKDLEVKIADFGLSRDIYEQDYYRDVDARRPLPVKWMALESLEEGKFTTKSDVWAFGILMWELQTRGCTPYPDVDAFDMKTYILCGNRMDMPDFAPEEIYAMMLRCWSEEPDDRPTFCEVFEELETFLNMQNTKTQLRSRQRQHVPSSIRVSNSKNFLSNGFS